MQKDKMEKAPVRGVHAASLPYVANTTLEVSLFPAEISAIASTGVEYRAPFKTRIDEADFSD